MRGESEGAREEAAGTGGGGEGGGGGVGGVGGEGREGSGVLLL